MSKVLACNLACGYTLNSISMGEKENTATPWTIHNHKGAEEAVVEAFVLDNGVPHRYT